MASVDCSAAKWQQNFTYDAFGNITKTVPTGGTGNSFQPTYSPTTNRFISIAGFTPTYDANGNVTNDSNHTYSWDANGNSINVDSVALTFDALDRMVEQNRSGVFTEIVYTPLGQKFALMNGATLRKAFIPLPAQAKAIYTPGGLDHYRHSDWLGSARLASSPSRSVLSTVAYAPFGETYVASGTPDLSFAGQDPDTVAGDYDLIYREYSNEGRWASPDPAGLDAVDSGLPQSWNRYAYVNNSSLSFTDPTGLVLEGPDGGGGGCDWFDLSCGGCLPGDFGCGTSCDPVFDPFCFGGPRSGGGGGGGIRKPRPFPWKELPAGVFQQNITGADDAAVITICVLQPEVCAVGAAVGVAIVVIEVIKVIHLSQHGTNDTRDTGIVKDAQDLIRQGVANEICNALKVLETAAKLVGDSQRLRKIRATQKFYGCRPSRQSR